jgi:hypothetical protein
MGNYTAYRVSGDRETVAAFRRLGLKSSDLSRAFDDIGRQIEHDASVFAPKVTGALSNDVRAYKSKTRATVVVGRKAVPYAAPINFGWPKRNIRPALFMQRAADDKADDSAVRIAREMDRLIRSAGLNS